MSPLKLAFLSLIRHRLTTTIAVIAIGLSVACGGILVRLFKLSESRYAGLGQGFDAIIGAKSGGLDILLGSLNSEGKYPGFLPYKLFLTLKAEQKVSFEDGASIKPDSLKMVIPFLYFAKYENLRLFGTDESFFERDRKENSLNFSQGKIFQQNTNEVVIGSQMAVTNKINVGDTLKVHPWIIEGPVLDTNIDLKVVGILSVTNSVWDRSAMVDLTYAHSVLKSYQSLINSKSIWGADVLNYFLVNLKPEGFSDLENLINKRTVGQIINVTDEKNRLLDLTGSGKSLGLFVTSFILILGGLCVCAMLISRFEGQKIQLAVLQALGYRMLEISKWLVFEGLMLGFLGVALGLAIDFFMFPFLRDSLGSALPAVELVSSSIFNSYLVWVSALLATVLATLIPLFRLSSQDVHQSLKGF